MPRMIFHYPGPFYDVLDTGEKKRPVKMAEAFEKIGYDVFRIIGPRVERIEKLSYLKKRYSEFDFLYSENSTMPLRLRDKSLKNLFYSPDYDMFNFCYRKNISCGIYYRDIFWKYYEFKKNLGFLKYKFALKFYKEELELYQKYCRKIFIPSEEIKCFLSEDKRDFFVLPPAEEQHDLPQKTEDSDNLNLIYVGSITPPKYNLADIISIISDCADKVKLGLISRDNELCRFAEFYGDVSGNITLHSLSGQQLSGIYKASDVALLAFNPDEYMKIALPLKLFEAIGYGLPILSFGDTAASRFIEENDIGWVVDDNSIGNIFTHLLANRGDIKKKRENVLKLRGQHTWQKRAETVRNILTANKAGDN